MGFFRLLTAGALGYIGYRAWQRRQPAGPASLRGSLHDDATRTPAHGDAVLAGADLDAGVGSRPSAHSSRGFGEES